MSKEPPAVTRTYTCSPHVRWVNDSDAMLVVDGRTLQAYRLEGIQAAVWRWLALAYPPAKAAALLAQWQSISDTEAQAMLAAMLEAWARQGLLDVAQDGIRG